MCVNAHCGNVRECILFSIGSGFNIKNHFVIAENWNSQVGTILDSWKLLLLLFYFRSFFKCFFIKQSELCMHLAPNPQLNKQSANVASRITVLSAHLVMRYS